MDDGRPGVIVLGAGVIGLTIGVCLAEQGLRCRFALVKFRRRRLLWWPRR